MDDVRVDKWLWAARFFKSRTAAQEACDGGHVQVNDVTAKCARPVKPGDMVRVVTPGGRKIVEVKALADKRGPATVAALLYTDHTPPPPPDEPRILRDAGEGRPTKRDRRLTDRFRGRQPM